MSSDDEDDACWTDYAPRMVYAMPCSRCGFHCHLRRDCATEELHAGGWMLSDDDDPAPDHDDDGEPIWPAYRGWTFSVEHPTAQDRAAFAALDHDHLYRDVDSASELSGLVRLRVACTLDDLLTTCRRALLAPVVDHQVAVDARRFRAAWELAEAGRADEVEAAVAELFPRALKRLRSMD